MNVAVIDYGAGNVASVERALERLGVESTRAQTLGCLSKAQALLLPGVGHYSSLVRALDERGLRGPLLESLARGVPFLGICLGLQALYESSQEAPELVGLGVIPGCVQALPAGCKLPHMGWNQLCFKRESQLFAGIASDSFFYFAHSYAACAATRENGTCVTATCMYGTEFVAALERQNIYAVQFHPEKSGAAGARLLENFARIAR
jgi:imidazole glycerol phosphate synthase glutamine amidotransferase subunit